MLIMRYIGFPMFMAALFIGTQGGCAASGDDPLDGEDPSPGGLPTMGKMAECSEVKATPPTLSTPARDETSRMGRWSVNGGAFLNDAVVDAGQDHTLAVDADGALWSWGGNYYGQLGDGSSIDHNEPVQMTAMDGYQAVSAGYYFSVGLLEDGMVTAWGLGDKGQLGNGANINASAPVTVSNLSNVIEVSAGGSHVLALRGDGKVFAWGANGQGQLGTGTSLNSNRPVAVTMLSSIVAVAAGSLHSVALKSDGTVWTWGDNTYGQLGINSLNPSSQTPVQVRISASTTLTGVVAIAAGDHHTLALTHGGKMYAWGYNGYGQLGTGDTTNKNIAVQVKASSTEVLANVVTIAAGGRFSLATRADGTVYGWGRNGSGELGVNTTASIYAYPTLTRTGASGSVPLTSVVSLAAGYTHALATRSDGTAWAWGSNSKGQVGDGTTTNRIAAVQVLNLIDLSATSVAGGTSHSLALLPDGTVYGWGRNDRGQLGDGTSSNSLVPVQTKSASFTPLNHVIALAAGESFSMALRSDGTVWTWGDNSYGQLGHNNASVTTSPFAVQVKAQNGAATVILTGVVAITAGDRHALALKSDGTLWGWGDNRYGQLGNPTSIQQSPSALSVKGATGATTTGWIAVAAGREHALALNFNGGRVYAWGHNDAGQLGTGNTVDTTYPTQVRLSVATSLTNGRVIAAGARHSGVARSDGTLLAWGDNSYGQLGNGTTTAGLYPVTVKTSSGNFSQAVSLTSGAFHMAVRRSDGSAWAWGLNDNGQLGSGTTLNQTVAMQVKGSSGVLTGVKQLAAGGLHSLAVHADGSFHAWGDNAYGQLGDSSTADQSLAVEVSGL